MELGKKIRQLRFKAGLTQEQLAEQMGVVPQSVSKWETGAAMPDISLLPLIAETFGVTIDDLFDLTNEQRFSRIEHRMDIEDDLPQDVFLEYEQFLRGQVAEEKSRKRATELLAYLYWHRMEMFSKKAARYAKEAIRMSPAEKGSQWILNKAAGYAAWDWNMRNHTRAVEFFRELADENPDSLQTYYYLLDNLIADHRSDEADGILAQMRALKDSDPMICEVYRAHIALARFDERSADAVIENLLEKHPDDFACLFEAAQYYAEKTDYDQAVALYERAFEAQSKVRNPRFQDELMAIRDIYEIRGDYEKAAETCGRILDLLKNEWGITEGDELKNVEAERDRLLAKV